MKTCHKLDKMKDLEIKCIEKELDLVNEWKLVGITIDQHLEGKSHINKIIKECYATLSILKNTLPFTCGNN